MSEMDNLAEDVLLVREILRVKTYCMAYGETLTNDEIELRARRNIDEREKDEARAFKRQLDLYNKWKDKL